MKHIFKQGTDLTKPVILLLHGTGGNERDMLPLADKIDKEASALSVRGEVLENGMPRFFRRLAEGVYDEEDLVYRTKILHEFLDDAAKQYHFDRANIVAMGYSNGANIAASLLFHHEHALRGAILHHPLFPRDRQWPDLAQVSVLITAGYNDPICPAQQSTELHEALVKAGAQVDIHWEHHGHSLSPTEIQFASEWYRTNYHV